MTDAVLRARALLAVRTPLKRDCGRLCGGACCCPDETGRGGMLLFPGEEGLYGPGQTWASVTTSDFTACGSHLMLLTCEGACPRNERPLACRLFPLTPLEEAGAPCVRLDLRAWAVCPLMEQGTQALDPAFVNACEEATALLWQDEACRAYISALTAHLQQMARWP